jgi:caffeoyl-CoA O-methyltransferase
MPAPAISCMPEMGRPRASPTIPRTGACLPMTSRATTASLLAFCLFVLAVPALADPPMPKEVQAVLSRIKAADTNLLAVSEEDGRFLRLLVAARGAKRVLEIGGANGYSAIWIGLGLRETGGRMVTIEYDPQRAKDAEANIRAAGLADIVQVISGDAFAAIPKQSGTFDFVFCDAWKKDYQRFFDLVFPRLDKGGVFVAHNVVNKKSEMGDFLATIRTHPGILSAIVSPSGEGVSVSVKR